MSLNIKKKGCSHSTVSEQRLHILKATLQLVMAQLAILNGPNESIMEFAYALLRPQTNHKSLVKVIEYTRQ